METTRHISCSIRSFTPEDAAACKALFVEVGGSIAANDTCYDMEDICAAYMRHPGNHFWVAQTPDGDIVGMIGIQQHDEGVGEIRRLRVANPYRRRGIGSALVETALRFCQERQYLKV